MYVIKTNLLIEGNTYHCLSPLSDMCFPPQLTVRNPHVKGFHNLYFRLSEDCIASQSRYNLNFRGKQSFRYTRTFPHVPYFTSKHSLSSCT